MNFAYDSILTVKSFLAKGNLRKQKSNKRLEKHFEFTARRRREQIQAFFLFFLFPNVKILTLLLIFSVVIKCRSCDFIAIGTDAMRNWK